MANWIHSLAPPSVIDDPANGYTHRNIAYAGGLGEFWNWQPVDGISEAVNDCDGELTNFYAVLRSPELFEQLARCVEFTQFNEGSFQFTKANGLAAQVCNSMVAKAWKFLVSYRMSRQGLGKDYATPTTRTRRGMNENVSAWLSGIDSLPDCHERLRRVEVRNMDAIKFIEQYDHKRALFYLDPPYMPETRSSKGEYGPHEMTPPQHNHLLSALSMTDGKFMLSGYRCDLYDKWALNMGWFRVDREIDNKASSSKTKEKRIESLWTNYKPPTL